MPTRPVVSLVTATRMQPERRRYLTELYASLSRQTLTTWQWILVIDCSSEPVPTAIIADPRVTTLRLFEPVGAGLARNLGLALAEADLVTAVDDDDMLPPDSLEVRVRALRALGVEWVAGRSADLFEDRVVTWECPTPTGHHAAGEVMRFWPDPAASIPLSHVTVLTTRQLAIAAGGYGPLPSGEDFIYVHRITTEAAGYMLPNVVYHYRQHLQQGTETPGHHQIRNLVRQLTWEQGHALASRRATHSNLV
ncbi:glycosyltransferase family A protein [Streptomyces sp. H27-C3]|uniref:glycosyltransferase family 2 protein n=1 Tax=Streptomyces sp. H27-C3 TaxID=3046305 RepID=UPI0024B8E1C7|nr:glycosyltransferase family A protein [Streptomyces sp. H27-C3]MDJ0465865.1 glycosyltransferase family A protein [Streptomyces sp. H27-C3]